MQLISALLALVLWSCGPTKISGGNPPSRSPESDAIERTVKPDTPDKSSKSEKTAKDELIDETAEEKPAAPPVEPDETSDDPPALIKLTEIDALAKLPVGKAQLKVLCDRPGNDRVRQAFCVENPPNIASLRDLQRALSLEFVNPNLTQRNQNGTGGNPGFAITGHSSSLVGKFTNAINPRAVIFTPLTGNAIPDYVAMGFVRGEQFVEIMANDPQTNVAAMFLVHFQQACNAQDGGCKTGELLTPAIESQWTSYTIYEDKDLANTLFDCLQCHQPNGPGTPKLLRMQELRDPWTHWMRDNRDGGRALLADYRAAKGNTEEYAGIPPAVFPASEPADLEDFIRDQGFGNQPNEFRGEDIEDEVQDSSPQQPADNSVAGSSATWQALYDAYVAGQFIAPPYHDVKVTDPLKLATATTAYQEFQSGSRAAAALPDLRNILRADRLHEMGFAVDAALNANQVLVNACAQCHNDRLDQSLSRAKFNVNLATMSRAAKDVAIERLKLPIHHPLAMPPERFRVLSEAQKQALIQLLSQ